MVEDKVCHAGVTPYASLIKKICWANIFLKLTERGSCIAKKKLFTFEDCLPFVQDLENMDADELLNKQVQQMEKERRERETRLKTQEKKVWHIGTGML